MELQRKQRPQVEMKRFALHHNPKNLAFSPAISARWVSPAAYVELIGALVLSHICQTTLRRLRPHYNNALTSRGGRMLNRLLKLRNKQLAGIINKLGAAETRGAERARDA